MGSDSKIEWTHHTFNPWRGCSQVSAGCDHCYAEMMSRRNPAVLGVWGADGARAIAAESYWQLPLKWDAAARQAGERRRVFCASLADVFEGPETMPAKSWPLVEAARLRLFGLIEQTPRLDWLLLTKRPQNMLALAPPRWASGWPPNVVAMTSVEDQAAADERIPALRRVPARRRGLSCEPLLGPADLLVYLRACPQCGGSDHDAHSCYDPTGIDWIIAGGESGHGARPMHPDWARSLRDQCQDAGVAFFFKQWGEWLPSGQTRPARTDDPIAEMGRDLDRPRQIFPDGTVAARIGKARAGRLLDGRTWDDFPPA